MIIRAAVVRGYGRGKRLGFPTLNLAIPREFPFPYGIYAGLIWCSGKRRLAAIHYGPIPSFGVRAPSLEAFILDDAPRMVPRTVAAELIAWLRPVRRFPTPNALSRQIGEDVEAVRALFSVA